MQKVAELLAELETALDDCSKWAGGTECRQNANGYEREYSLTALVNVLQWLDAAAHGQPLTAEQEQAARRIISLTRSRSAKTAQSGAGQGVCKSSQMQAPQTAAQQRENFREIQRGDMPKFAGIRRRRAGNPYILDTLKRTGADGAERNHDGRQAHRNRRN